MPLDRPRRVRDRVRRPAAGGIGTSPSGPRRSYVKHDTSAASSGARQIVEQPFADRFGDEQIGLGVEAGELLARRR